MLSALFWVERLRGYSPGAPNINVSSSPFFFPNERERRRVGFSISFSISTPSVEFRLLSRVAFSSILPLTGTFLSVFSGRVRADIAEERRINSQVLSDTIARITASCVSFSRHERVNARGDLRKGKGEGGRRG